MTLEETVSNDITCLYAAKNISQYVVLKQPEPVRGIAAIQALQNILETKCKAAIQDIDILLRKDNGEGDSPESEKVFNKLVTRTYKQIKAEVSDLYKKLKASGLPKDDEKEFKKFLKEFKNEDFQMIVSGFCEQEAFKETAESSPNANEMIEFGKKADEAHANYLASAGINTDEGKAAWTIAHCAGLMFSRAIYHPDDSHVDKDTIKIRHSSFEDYIRSAINDGLRCASEKALIDNIEKLRASSVSWLSNEIKGRLSKGLEFNLLDSVSVRKGKDNYVYIKLDDREPYTI